MFISSSIANPVYLVSPTGEYVRDEAGNPRIFGGEAIETHPSGYLVDAQGNFLFKNNSYMPAPRPINQPATPTGYTLQHTPPHTQHTTFPAQPSTNQEEEAGKRWALILFGVLLALGLGTGGGFLVYHFFGDDSQAHETEAKQNNTTVIQLPPEAYPGAGTSEIPAGAERADDIIMSPTHNLHCDLSSKTTMECRADNWATDQIYGANRYGVSLSTTDTTELVPSTVSGGTEVPYGTVVYNGNWVCASEDNGLTCWSRQSGHGFLINRSGYKAF